MQRPPGQCDRDQPDLDEQDVPVGGRPEIAQARKAQHTQVGAGQEQHPDAHRCEPGEGEERRTPRLRQQRPHDDDELHQAADPETRRGEVRPVGELRLPRRPGVGR